MLERRLVALHGLDKHNKYSELLIKIDGSALTTTSATAGVTIGTKFCTAKDDGSDVVTITFNEALRNAPEVVATQALTADCIVKPDAIATTTTTVVYSCVKISDGATAVNDADVVILLRIPEGYEVV